MELMVANSKRSCYKMAKAQPDFQAPMPVWC